MLIGIASQWDSTNYHSTEEITNDLPFFEEVMFNPNSNPNSNPTTNFILFHSKV